MAISKNSGRQWPQVARVEFTYADAGAAVVASPNILEVMNIPVNAIILRGYINVTTAWVGPTVATVDIGDGGDPDRYTSSPISLLAAAKTDFTAGLGYQYTAADTIDIDYVQTVAPSTAGAAEIVVEYIIEDKANEVVPN